MQTIPFRRSPDLRFGKTIAVEKEELAGKIVYNSEKLKTTIFFNFIPVAENGLFVFGRKAALYRSPESK